MTPGSDVFKSLASSPRRADDSRPAGRRQRFKDAGFKNAVCFNQEVGNQARTLRCNGFLQAWASRSQAGKS